MRQTGYVKLRSNKRSLCKGNTQFSFLSYLILTRMNRMNRHISLTETDLYMKIKSILIHEYQHGSTRINTSPTRINTSQHESDTNQHESTRVQHESTRVNTSPKQVMTFQK